MKNLEGKTLSAKILAELPGRCSAVKAARGFPPSLAIVNFYPDSPSGVYARKKMAACAKAGIETRLFSPSPNSSYAEFRNLVKQLGNNSSFDAIMLERPLPAGFDKQETWDFLPAEKDADGLSTFNMGRLLLIKKFEEIEQNGFFVPCTALAVVKLMKYHDIKAEGARIAIAGRSTVVGKPLAHMLTALNATVTLCHTKTNRIEDIFRQSNIIISAAGKAKWIKKEMLPEGAVLIDVGTNLDENGKICGDAEPACAEKCSAFSPVPGGVGPITKALLLEATVKAAEKQIYSSAKEKKENK